MFVKEEDEQDENELHLSRGKEFQSNDDCQNPIRYHEKKLKTAKEICDRRRTSLWKAWQCLQVNG